MRPTVLFVIVAFIASIMAMSAANAHGGRTNSDGCHHKRKDNTYHCH
ncbi:MAG: YHYH domain-containing protein [Rhizobiaceae bacterium]|nr:YHYH domain-containing protein [Rhizobiaceae bacterium]